MAALWLLFSTGGCASPPLAQPPETSHMKQSVGTPDELSPLAPPEARNVRKVGDHWLCDLNGRVMVYDKVTSSWQPQK